MLTRRQFLEVAAATAALPAWQQGALAAAARREAIREEDLLRFEAIGQVTILHTADIHAQLVPLYHREPAFNIGVGDMRGEPPHLTGAAMLDGYGIPRGSLAAYMLAAEGFAPLARAYGRVGGMDRLARLMAAIRAERGDKVLALDGGDLLQGSYTSLVTQGGDMIRVAEALGFEATTGHWEFTLGEARIAELFGADGRHGTARVPFLAGNVVETEFAEPAFASTRMFDKGGVRIAVIGQAFPYTPIANPRWMIPRWSFGIRERRLQRHVDMARAAGASVVVLLSHNGFDVDRKLATRVRGLDVILTAHTHDALPAPVQVGRTLLVASGSHGKFLSRLDLDIEAGRVKDFRYALIPVLADAIRPHGEMTALVDDIRAPHAARLGTTLATTQSLLYRRDTIKGTLDDVICHAMLQQRDAEICLSPGFRWGATLLPDQPITEEDVYNATAITYPACYRTRMTGERIKTILEDVADNLFNPDPYYQQGGDMVRVGGMSFVLDPEESLGNRVSGLTLTRTSEPIDAAREYWVAGWGSVAESVEGPPIWDVVKAHLAATRVVDVQPTGAVRVVEHHP